MTYENAYIAYCAIFPIHNFYGKMNWARIGTMVTGGRDDSWQVVGITYTALRLMAEAGGKKVKRIQRAHITARSDTWEILRERLHSFDEFKDLLSATDKTILATSSENHTNSLNDVVLVDPALGLFKTKNIGWKHQKAEMQFIMQLAEQHGLNQKIPTSL